ncbi:hypothetical protein RQM47_06520 [Rubrivirga sp. S365]|uniref:Uncharacterized protein n=1 Tax=Rubrivirga litoralis TaxID=3075598 RepID=A0ABU3BSJ7_9BACT|nr:MULTISPECIES: hypothetical protein [unclassified Rubrivirga]MDT0632259.1 hypothetical protein [Rubrivirga sp. F394]MDT7856287.1 hypothetical protein [Rubrivirga sp. S365]
MPTTPLTGRLAAGLAGLALAAGCTPAPPLYASEPVAETAPVVVDGAAGEWPQALRPVPREGGLTVGLRHTDDALYVVLVAGDERQIRRVSAGGLRLWLDPEGGTERVLGIGYPLPLPTGIARGGSVEKRRFEERLDRVAVQRGGGAEQTFAVDRLDGLEAAAQWTDRALVVELRVPLGADSPVAVAPGEALGVGVELLASGAPPPTAPPRRGPGAEAEERETPTVTRWLRTDLAR